MMFGIRCDICRAVTCRPAEADIPELCFECARKAYMMLRNLKFDLADCVKENDASNAEKAELSDLLGGVRYNGI